jgi:hypothetical protein
MMNRFRSLSLAALAALPLSAAAAEARFGLQTQWGNPLLPGFYEAANKRFIGLRVSVPVLPRLEVGGGVAGSLPRFEGPYNDMSNINGTTALFKAGAEVEAFRAGPARFFVGAGVDYLRSRWDADDRAYEDPDVPEEFWSGAFTRWPSTWNPASSFSARTRPSIGVFPCPFPSSWACRPFWMAREGNRSGASARAIWKTRAWASPFPSAWESSAEKTAPAILPGSNRQKRFLKAG